MSHCLIINQSMWPREDVDMGEGGEQEFSKGRELYLQKMRKKRLDGFKKMSSYILSFINNLKYKTTG